MYMYMYVYIYIYIYIIRRGGGGHDGQRGPLLRPLTRRDAVKPEGI